MGWKDILRPIRDGLRDNLPSRQPREDHERESERIKQRQEDALRGFAYFDTFDQVEEWTADDVDPLQRANTPLMARLPLPGHLGKDNKSNITLIHDYSGNYHSYESAQQSLYDKPSYTCSCLRYVDRFVYFSHKLACLPPPSWTNILHRNGVKSLGTFLVEPQSQDIARILETRIEDGRVTYVMARQLAEMARTYGFDGWLINIEKTFPALKWSEAHLVAFLSQLRLDIGSGNVIWYDALTVNNRLSYQNGLTMLNLSFAKAAGCILTNYAWTPAKAQATKELALKNDMNLDDVVCGIDVWAQNVSNGEHPRKTWPLDGGGGTGTGLGVAALAQLGLSSGIFAPAWPFEHFPNDSRAVERSMWEGDALPPALECDCKPTFPHNIGSYQTSAISKYATEHPAGTESLFYTDFEGAFEIRDGKYLAHIGAQCILPILKHDGGAIFADLWGGPSRLVVYLDASRLHGGSRVFRESILESTLKGNKEGNREEKREGNGEGNGEDTGVDIGQNTDLPTRTAYMRLYNLNVSWKSPLVARIRYRRIPALPGLTYALHFEGNEFSSTKALDENTNQDITFRMPTREDASSAARLTGLRLDVSGLSAGEGIFDILEIFEISIQRDLKDDRQYSIHCLRLEKRDQDCCPHFRLCWGFSINGESRPEGMPYSDTTGPFAYFEVSITNDSFGRAYALEYVLDKSTAERIEDDDDLMINVKGYGFDGSYIASICQSVLDLRHSEESWQMVDSSDGRIIS